MEKNVKSFSNVEFNFEKFKTNNDGNSLVKFVKGEVLSIEDETLWKFKRELGLKKKVKISIPQQADRGLDSIMHITGTFFENWE